MLRRSRRREGKEFVGLPEDGRESHRRCFVLHSLEFPDRRSNIALVTSSETKASLREDGPDFRHTSADASALFECFVAVTLGLIESTAGERQSGQRFGDKAVGRHRGRIGTSPPGREHLVEQVQIP